MLKKKRIIIFLIIILLVSSFLSFTIGQMKIELSELFDPYTQLVIFQFRLPRLLCAILVGGGMALAGHILQTVLQNDLADPGVILFFSAKLNRQKFSYVQLWNAGILTGTDWLKIALLITILVIIGVILWKYQDVLNIFSLGKESVITLGVDLKKQTIILISLAGFLAAFTIAFGGSIPFVGLIAPHIARRLVGSNHRYSLWVSMLMGSLMVIIGDSLSRSLMSTGEIPTGIILSLIGVPYFIYLLKKERA